MWNRVIWPALNLVWFALFYTGWALYSAGYWIVRGVRGGHR